MVNDFDNAVQNDPMVFAELYKFVDKNGVVLYRFTTWERSILFDDDSGSGEQVFIAIPGLDRDSLEQETGVRVGTMRVTIKLGDVNRAIIDVDEIRHNRKLDNGELYLYQVDVTNTLNYRLRFNGTTGIVKINRLAIEVEFKDIFHQLSKNVPIAIYGNSCNWSFGDDYCTLDIAVLKHSGTVTTTSKSVITDPTATEDDGYYDRGYIIATAGPNANIERPIKSYVTGSFTLLIPFDNDFVIGNGYEAIPFCQKTLSGCKRFNNQNNFSGYKYIPRPEQVHI